MKKVILHLFKYFGYSISKRGFQKDLYKDIKDSEFWNIYAKCKPFTMTSVERLYSLYCSVDYVLKYNINGAFVECGVWRGGSSMLIAIMLEQRKIFDRMIYLYDTFEGMPEPSKVDISIEGDKAEILLYKTKRINNDNSIWCFADLMDVTRNMKSTNYPERNIVYVKGKVEDTVPAKLPTDEIAILRLDTDWYESTKHELNILYPILVKNGVLIIDDYGHWQGCKLAVDEYFSQNNIPILFNRIDYTCRQAIKSE